MEICLEAIGKEIKGQQIFKNVNITLTSGMVYGFVGYNGCGKTMLLRVISGLVKPSYGQISINKTSYEQLTELPKIGIILEKPEFFNELTGLENLNLLAKIRNEISEVEVHAAIKRVGLIGQENKKVGKYSLGMKQRLGIAQAVMENNKILILDEVTSALDEDGVAMAYDIIKEAKMNDKIVILTSHNKIDIDELCDVIYKFNNGELYEADKD